MCSFPADGFRGQGSGVVQAAVSLTGWSEEGSDTLGFRERGGGGVGGGGEGGGGV